MSADDEVFLEDEKEREEYVLNDHGTLYMGTYKAPEGLAWVFGQFGALILPALTLLMEQAGLPHPARGSPVLMSRAISALVSIIEPSLLFISTRHLKIAKLYLK